MLFVELFYKYIYTVQVYCIHLETCCGHHTVPLGRQGCVCDQAYMCHAIFVISIRILAIDASFRLCPADSCSRWKDDPQQRERARISYNLLYVFEGEITCRFLRRKNPHFSSLPCFTAFAKNRISFDAMS